MLGIETLARGAGFWLATFFFILGVVAYGRAIELVARRAWLFIRNQRNEYLGVSFVIPSGWQVAVALGVTAGLIVVVDPAAFSLLRSSDHLGAELPAAFPDEGLPPPVASVEVPPVPTVDVVKPPENRRVDANKVLGYPVTPQRIELAGSMPACEICRQLEKKAALAFNSPDEMMFGEETAIELVLTPHTSGLDPVGILSKDLTGRIIVEETVYALRMQATLRGQAFDVLPPGPVQYSVALDREVKWAWMVRPKEFGSRKQLILAVEAIPVVGGPGEERDLPPIPVETFRAQIFVQVGVWDWLLHAAAQLTILQGALGGTIMTGVGVSMFWLWRRYQERLDRRREAGKIIGFKFPRKPVP